MKKPYEIWRCLAIASSIVVASLMMGIISTSKAHAQVPLNPNPSASMPAVLYNKMLNSDSPAYNPRRQSECYVRWVSPSGAPTSTSVTVAYGAQSVNLDYYSAGAVCLGAGQGNNGNALEERERIINVNPGSQARAPGGSSLVGLESRLDFTPDPNNNWGRYRVNDQPMVFSPGGAGFTTSRIYTITLTTANINHFAYNDTYQCVNNGAIIRGWNYAACPPDTVTLDLQINVETPVTVQTHVYSVNPDGTNAVAMTGITYETCNSTGNATQGAVDSATALKEFTIPRNVGYCIRINNPPPPGFSGPYIRPEKIGSGRGSYGSGCGPYVFSGLSGPPAGYASNYLAQHCGYSSYEWQESFALDGSVRNGDVWDRGAADEGFDFVYIRTPLSCQSDTPSSVETGAGFSVRLGASYSGTAGPITYIMTNIVLPGQNIKPLVGSAPDMHTFNVSGQSAGDYAISWTLASSLGTTNCTGIITIGNHPYLKIYGNDVAVGDEFQDSSGSCTASATKQATILTLGGTSRIGTGPKWWEDTSLNYTGSSTQFAAYTIGAIDQFYTAGLQNPSTAGGSSVPPVGLTFGNYGLSNSSQGVTNLGWLDVNKAYNYGGLGSMQRCIPDYYSKLTSGPGAPTAPTNTNDSVPIPLTQDGWYKPTGNYVTISGGSVSGQRAIAVDGDVYITGNITYSSWSDGIPSLYIVAKGNIYINPNVTQLAGVYVAQPTDSSGSNGVISTCANLQGGQPKSVTASNLFTTCNKQLTISGAFIAQKVQFLRSYGTVNQATPSESYTGATNAAEIFDAGPELYLNGPSALQTNANTYDSITSLPPIF